MHKVEESEKVRVEIISGSTWQTLHTFELDLLSPPPENIEITKQTCKILTLTPELDTDITCFLL